MGSPAFRRVSAQDGLVEYGGEPLMVGFVVLERPQAELALCGSLIFCLFLSALASV